jgi:hypothetical protein
VSLAVGLAATLSSVWSLQPTIQLGLWTFCDTSTGVPWCRSMVGSGSPCAASILASGALSLTALVSAAACTLLVLVYAAKGQPHLARSRLKQAIMTTSVLSPLFGFACWAAWLGRQLTTSCQDGGGLGWGFWAQIACSLISVVAYALIHVGFSLQVHFFAAFSVQSGTIADGERRDPVRAAFSMSSASSPSSFALTVRAIAFVDGSVPERPTHSPTFALIPIPAGSAAVVAVGTPVGAMPPPSVTGSPVPSTGRLSYMLSPSVLQAQHIRWEFPAYAGNSLPVLETKETKEEPDLSDGSPSPTATLSPNAIYIELF